MCGIIGVMNKKKDAIPMVVHGLESLEYRGYDSAGIAYRKGENIYIVKSTGRVQRLKEKLPRDEARMAIGHTRWATHGEASNENAHPHCCGSITIVHNGIIENYEELKGKLVKEGYSFQSTTDTEVACALLDFYYQKSKDIKESVMTFMKKVTGSYAIALFCKEDENCFYVLKKDSPLILGVGKDGNYIASDVPAILDYTDTYILLEDEEWAQVSAEEVRIYNKEGKEQKKEKKIFQGDSMYAQKKQYAHYMLKEMMEQPTTTLKTIMPYIEKGIDSLLEKMVDVSTYKQIDIIACGSAWHAGLVGKYLLEEKAGIRVNVELASEYRYKKVFLDKDSLVIVISQSGETADTLAALKKVKELKIPTLGIINVKESSIARCVDQVLYTEAGTEIAVATTKAYTAQVALLSLLALTAALKKKMITEEEGKMVIGEFHTLKKRMQFFLEQEDTYKEIAKRLEKEHDVFYLGRGLDYAVMMEGSLKLKEITYLHSECYAAGELKHGTISLMEEGSKVLVGATNKQLNPKTMSNAIEVIARGAEVILITNDSTLLTDKIKMSLILDDVSSFLLPLLEVLPLQMIAYYTGCLLKRDIDKPRNLAKSVTVE